MDKVYKVKNISEKEFRFEGVVVAPGEESGPLDLYLYQRLLALYLNDPLRPAIVDPAYPDSSVQPAAPVTEEIVDEQVAEEVVAPAAEESEPAEEEVAVPAEVEVPEPSEVEVPVSEEAPKKGRPKKQTE